jgi:TonB family protein
VNTQDRGVPGDGAKEISARKPDGSFAALQSCLIGGDAEQTGRERKLRSRSLVLSTLMQLAVLLAVIAAPFFSKAERITFQDFMPIPPYHSSGNAAREHAVAHPPPPGQRRNFCIMCPLLRPTNSSLAGNHIGPVGPEEPVIDDAQDGTPGMDCSSCIPIGKSNGPRPPDAIITVPSVVRMTHIDPAMLIERIEPAYPALALQTHREGRVELHAIISTDGTIEQLEVVSGDLLFYPSALNAVRRWRYRATMLNGQAVKVDTYITVIYTTRQ